MTARLTTQCYENHIILNIYYRIINSHDLGFDL